MPAITLPTTVESTPTTFTPAFPFVSQANDFDDVLAITGMLSLGALKTSEEVRQLAIAKARHPARGPYFYTEERIAALLAQIQLVASVYKEVSTVSDIPDVALLVVEYVPDMDMGRHILFHRAKATHTSGTTIEYALDPLPGIPPAERVRTDIKNLIGRGTWTIGVHQMKTKAGASK
ncbi:hypothetical protein C9I57_08280 [Trinickia symbiotica]|uniref:Uncharacterized protein n=1 Tax=Trinickia symbiotica TaxID=863227 RepID=A0A2T3XYM8_9BURK|nr:hypothetical protein [Trinickia symbiotica]PTB21615.1 hypothetical protein C9I57_08280 [Trinickia symbiotica]